MNLAKTIIVPGVFVTIDNSKANTALGGSFKTVLFGQKTSAGTATANTFTQVFSDAEAKALFGVGSILANMFSEWFKNNAVNEVYAVALDDNGAGTANTVTFTIAGTATAAGTISAYINGVLVSAAIASGDTETVAGDALETAINANVDIPVTAVNTAGTVVCTFANKGEVGNEIDARLNVATGEETPAGLTNAATIQSIGATDPVTAIATAVAALPDEVIALIISPYTDAASQTALDVELTRRWGNTVQIDGHGIMAFGGTSSTVVTEGGTVNSEFFTILDSGKTTMVPAYLVAAELGGRVAESADADPARPFRTLPITGMIGDDPSDRRTFSEKNSILNAGIATHNVQNDGTVVVDRLVTTYKTNGVGAIDTSYRNTNTMFNLSFMRQSYKIRMLSLYPRHKLADDGTRFGAGQPIATPSSIKGDTIALYQEWIDLGLAEDIEAFAESLSVERDATNRSRVNTVMQPILIGQLYQFDTTLQFIV